MTKRILMQCPDLKRLRLSSIDPVEVDEDLFHLMATEPRLMPHFHISLQAGDDMILKRMKRRHLRQDAIDFCNRVRTLRPDVVFGADIIAGFPTESNAMFQNSLDLIKDCNLTYLHVFPYSARQGTPAARMPQVPMTLRKERAAKLRTLGQEQERLFYESRIGTIASLLVEAGGKGHTEHFAPVTLEDGYTEAMRGTVVPIRITGVTPKALLAIPL
jgi:threonylcarbamoyladenosine tRNA methylthiotransferase MtaB